MSQPSDPETSATSGSWREAAMEFVSARMDLLALEAKDVANRAARKTILAAFAAGCAATFWLCLIAGIIGWIAAAGHPWHFVALGAAVFHLTLGGIAAVVIRRPTPPPFPLSRAELEKDRQWLSHPQDTPKP